MGSECQIWTLRLYFVLHMLSPVGLRITCLSAATYLSLTSHLIPWPLRLSFPVSSIPYWIRIWISVFEASSSWMFYMVINISYSFMLVILTF
jgi:hypothetical protein